jgi:hypothetical protein
MMETTMKTFEEYFQIREQAEQLTSGPGIERLKATFLDMGDRGAPTEYDDLGFNKTHWNYYTSIQHKLGKGDPIPTELAFRTLEVLRTYKNTQVHDYEEIAELVHKDVEDIQSHLKGEELLVYDKEPKNYGKIKVYIPGGLDRSLTMAINKALDKYFDDQGMEKDHDRFGNYGHNQNRWKHFNKDKGHLNIYWIRPEVLEIVVDALQSKKDFQVATQSGQPIESFGTGAPTKAPDSSSDESDDLTKIKVYGVINTPYGKQIVIDSLPREVYAAMKDKGLTPRGIVAQNTKDGWRNNININSDLYHQVHDVLKHYRIDTREIDKLMVDEKSDDQPDKTDFAGTKISFEDLSPEECKAAIPDHKHPCIKISLDYRNYNYKSAEHKKLIKQSLQYGFPHYKWVKTGDRSGYYVADGSYKQYIKYGQVLKDKLHVSKESIDQLRDIVKKKLANNEFEKVEFEGFRTNDEQAEFIKNIDNNLPHSKFDLYPQQKEGIAFLHSRDHAVLGDETGLGKTVQLVGAAEIKMQKTNRPTLIVTLRATQDQWVKEIESVVGKTEISSDPLNPKKWTVVYYNNFSQGKKVPEYVNKLSNTNFGIVIFDELHKLKHSAAKWTRNIKEVTDSIPTKWGATATLSANKPMDVKGQLEIIGHWLGDVKEKKFKAEFAGAYADDPEEAVENLNKWLNLTGVYVRRSKSEIRKMPNLKVGKEIAYHDEGEFSKRYKETISKYKNPTLAVSKLIAARESIAAMKVPETVKKVIKTVADNQHKPDNNYAASKVVVFTNFKESGKRLADQIRENLQKINPKFKLITYLGDTPSAERREVKNNFTNDPNAKVLVMSMKMGSTGIDFPNAARNMVINDFDWTPESAEQSEGRIYRINTDHPVDISYMVSQGIDSNLFDKVQKKRELAAIIHKFRQELHERPDDEATVGKIVKAKKEMKKLDQDLESEINKLTSETVEEGFDFRRYFDHCQDMKRVIF